MDNRRPPQDQIKPELDFTQVPAADGWAWPSRGKSQDVPSYGRIRAVVRARRRGA